MRWETIKNGNKQLEAICCFGPNETKPAPVTIYTVNHEGEVRTFEFKIDPEKGVINCKKIIPQPPASSFLDSP